MNPTRLPLPALRGGLLALLASWLNQETVDRRVWAAMGLLLAVLFATAAWGMDNTLSRALAESHGHEHEHEDLVQEHAHRDDDSHHDHVHGDMRGPMPAGLHSHPHHHPALRRTHTRMCRTRTTRIATERGRTRTARR